jgi:hypothetical protein
VDVALLGREVDALTLRGRLAAVDAGDDVVGLPADVGGAVDVGVRAELLHQVDRGLQALTLADQLHVLGPDADRELAARLVGDLRRLARDRQVGAPEVQRAPVGLHLEEVHRRRADEPCDEDVVGVVVHVAWRVHLLEDAVLQHGDPVAHRHGLDLVVGDVDGGDPEPPLQRRDLAARLDAELGVEVGQRLVHQEDLRRADDGAAHGDPLALATGQCLRLAVEVLLEVEDLGGLGDPLVDLLLGLPGDLEGEAHVLGDGHVRVERIVLEHHRDVAVLGREVGDVAVADADRTAVDVLETGEHAQRGGLAAAGRADEDEELAVADLDVECVHGGAFRPGEESGCLVERHCRHEMALPSPAGTCRTIRVRGSASPRPRRGSFAANRNGEVTWSSMG